MNRRSQADAKAIESAEKRISSINELLRNPHFEAFIQRFRNQADELGRSITDDEMTAEGREARRQFRLGILEVIQSPAIELDACVRTLKMFGIEG